MKTGTQSRSVPNQGLQLARSLSAIGTIIVHELDDRDFRVRRTDRGVNDKRAALAIGAELGLDSAALDTLSEEQEIKDVLLSHMSLSASLGLNGTPSFLINGMVVIGYPGPETMRRIVGSVLKCDSMVC